MIELDNGKQYNFLWCGKKEKKGRRRWDINQIGAWNNI